MPAGTFPVSVNMRIWGRTAVFRLTHAARFPPAVLPAFTGSMELSDYTVSHLPSSFAVCYNLSLNLDEINDIWDIIY